MKRIKFIKHSTTNNQLDAQIGRLYKIKSTPKTQYPTSKTCTPTTNHQPLITKHFTLVEMLMSVFVLSILILIMGQFYSYTITATDRASSQIEVFENARTALDLIASELMCMKVGENKEYPFERTDNSIAFISETPLIIDLNTGVDKKNLSKLYEVQYQFNSDKTDPEYGFLERSITGNIEKNGDNNESAKRSWYE
jgi:type II secretory pathway pseudopilin PulG